MERKIIHGSEIYTIAINNTAVDAIEHSMINETYIPNTITLNIADDSEADYEYDNDNHKLIIRSIKYFDIVDGYHRLRAMSLTSNKDESFDYPMELRIITFDESIAQQFIYQEDQKTKMSKVDSNSYNHSDAAVYICEKLAQTMGRGIISRNQNVIDLANLVQAVKDIYNTNKISVNNTEHSNIKEKDSSYCRTTKHNKIMSYVNYKLNLLQENNTTNINTNLNNMKNYMPFSPKM